MICSIFKHSPVFRVAGDQFAVIAQGHDLDYLDSLTRELKEMSKAHSVNVAIGAAVYDGSENAASVFARAERLCMEDQNSHDEL
jgi:GGDEF domain-containing protein